MPRQLPAAVAACWGLLRMENADAVRARRSRPRAHPEVVCTAVRARVCTSTEFGTNRGPRFRGTGLEMQAQGLDPRAAAGRLCSLLVACATDIPGAEGKAQGSCCVTRACVWPLLLKNGSVQ